jgi:hypothetical protein
MTPYLLIIASALIWLSERCDDIAEAALRCVARLRG